MNTVTPVDTEYLRPSRTIDILSVVNEQSMQERLFYIYNYEGTHFRLFYSLTKLISFFNNEDEADYDSESEDELHGHLEKIDLLTFKIS